MFGTLLESRPQKQRSWGGTTFSVIAHGALIVAAVNATARAVAPPPEDVEQHIVIDDMNDDIPKPPPPDVPSLPPQGPPVLNTVIEIPVGLPPIDFSKPITNEGDWRGAPTLHTAPGAGHAAAPSTDSVFFEFMVEKPVAEASNTQRPRYPDLLKSAGVEGTVLAQFVVDTLGRVENGSFRVLSSSHELFTAAVRSVLPGMRFLPAEVGGRKVRQLVQQPFVFAIAK